MASPPLTKSSSAPGSGALLPDLLEGRGLLDGELELAEIVGIFGVRGEVRLHLHNRESDWLDRWRDLVVMAPDGRRYAAKVKARGGSSDRVIAAIQGIEDRDVARGLAGCKIVVDRSRLPKPAEGEVYVWQIVGLPVFTPDGVERGKVVEVHTNCPTPILEVALPGVRDPAFVVLLPGTVDIDVAAKRVQVPEDALTDVEWDDTPDVAEGEE